MRDGTHLVQALFQGRAGRARRDRARIEEITRSPRGQPAHPRKDRRLDLQERRAESAWRLVDAAGWRGVSPAAEHASPLHANFLINGGTATAAELEGLGEAVARTYARSSASQLEWEIKRVGRAAT